MDWCPECGWVFPGHFHIKELPPLDPPAGLICELDEKKPGCSEQLADQAGSNYPRKG